MIQPLHVIAHRLHILSFMKARSYVHALLMEVGIGQRNVRVEKKQHGGVEGGEKKYYDLCRES